MNQREILHLYDLDHIDDRRYAYAHNTSYAGWSAKEMNDELVEKCLNLDITEVWTFQIETENSPRFRQWHIDDHEVVKGDCWVPSNNLLLCGWKPDIHFHFVYQIKKHLGFRANDVYVSSDHLEERKSLTTLGVHLV